MDDLGAFLKQVPAGLLLAPLFFGGLYLVLMVYIFQRGAARRKKRREALFANHDSPKAPSMETPPARRPAFGRAPMAAALPIPEPDFDLLLAGAPVQAAFGRELAVIPDRFSEVLPMAAPNQSTNQQQTTDTPADAVEVMRIWRDLSDGGLIIQMGDKRYRSVNEIASNPDLLRRFTGLVRELWAMATNGATARTVDPASAASLESLLGASAQPRVGLLKDQIADEPQPRPGVLRQIGRSVTGQPAAGSKNERRSEGITDVVEEFLQFKLMNHPEFSTRSVHIRPAADGGVRIEVDGRSYDGIGDVADMDVRDFLASVMKEWEARQ